MTVLFYLSAGYFIITLNEISIGMTFTVSQRKRFNNGILLYIYNIRIDRIGLAIIGENTALCTPYGLDIDRLRARLALIAVVVLCFLKNKLAVYTLLTVNNIQADKIIILCSFKA